MSEWKPIDSAPRNKCIFVSDGENKVKSFYGKVSHVPIYGWLDCTETDIENMSLIKFEPKFWREMSVNEYLKESLKLFEIDPADSDYQDGYKDALEDALRYFSE